MFKCSEVKQRAFVSNTQYPRRRANCRNTRVNLQFNSLESSRLCKQGALTDVNDKQLIKIKREVVLSCYFEVNSIKFNMIILNQVLVVTFNSNKIIIFESHQMVLIHDTKLEHKCRRTSSRVCRPS